MHNNVNLFSKVGTEENSAREARHLHDLQGPGVVALHGRGCGGELVLAKAACSLADVLDERGPLPVGAIRAVGAAAAGALARVHRAGLVHGDVKPANLLLSHEGELWLADFDAAAAADGQPLSRSSPPRLPPGTPARPAADITALALALVELSTGALLDSQVQWRAVDLRRLGCSATLSAEIAMMLGADGSALSAQATAEMFERGGTDSLPAPAVNARSVDPTPTVEFMPVRPSPESTVPAEGPAAERPARWWKRLYASWRPAAPTSDR